MAEIHFLLLVLSVENNLSSPLLFTDRNDCPSHLPHGWVEFDINKQRSGLVQSLLTLQVELAAQKNYFLFLQTTLSVFFSVVVFLKGL